MTEFVYYRICNYGMSTIFDRKFRNISKGFEMFVISNSLFECIPNLFCQYFKKCYKFNDLPSNVNNFDQQIWSWSFWYKNAEFKSKKIQHRVNSEPMDPCLFNMIHCWCDWYFFSIVIFECVWSLQMSHVQLIVALLISLTYN